MNKKLFKIVLCFTFILFNIINVNALSIYPYDETPEPYINDETNYKAIIEDDASLLTPGERIQLMNDMTLLTEYGNVIFKTINENHNTTSRYAEDYYNNNFSNSSGTLFLIDMDKRMIYIFSDGENYKHITDGKAEIITDNIYKYASNKEYYECARRAFEQIYTILQGGKISEPMRYISNIFIAMTLGFFITFIYILITSGSKKSSSNEVINGCSVAFNVSNISAVKTDQIRVYSPPSSSSSGGGSSGGGGGGGGGSSGGGGGHSF